MKKILSFIPARGNSKGIPLKNLAKLNDQSLLHYTVNASLNSELINRTIVSTDNKKIKEESKRLGAEVVNRPKNLSGDKIGIEPSIQHTLDFLKKKENYVPDVIVLLSNTHPFRTSAHIDEALLLLFKKKYDSVLSGYDQHTFFWKKQSNSTIIPLNYDPQKRPNRQDMDLQLFENGALFATTYSAFIKSKCRISGKIGFYKMPLHTSYNIDTPNDLIDAEKLMQKQNLKNIFSIENKIVVITGGSRGIGNAIANEFATRNSIVFILDKIIPKKNKLNNISYIKCDITNNAQIHNACQNILKKNKKIHVLINNAGITIPNNTENDYSLKNWEKTLNVNLTGAFICTQAIVKTMKKQKDGSIINITSINAEVGFPNNPAYVASKGGLKMLTKSFAKDYGKYGIRVNSLGPGYIKTDMTKTSYENKKTRNAREKQTLLGKWGDVSDLIGPCIFLASDSSKYITGQDIYVDGGWLSNGLIEWHYFYDENFNSKVMTKSHYDIFIPAGIRV